MSVYKEMEDVMMETGWKIIEDRETCEEDCELYHEDMNVITIKKEYKGEDLILETLYDRNVKSDSIKGLMNIAYINIPGDDGDIFEEFYDKMYDLYLEVRGIKAMLAKA